MKRLGTRHAITEEEEAALRARLTELCGDATELTARRAALRRRFAALWRRLEKGGGADPPPQCTKTA